jgi:hypothetical protein
MNPGLGMLCRGCQHFSAHAWNEGHPNPCRRNCWICERHHSPAIAADGRSCQDFRQRAGRPGIRRWTPLLSEANSPESDSTETPQREVLT